VAAKPAVFRVRAKLSDRYKSEFGDAGATHLSISLREKGGKPMQGYVARNTTEGQKVFDALKDGNEHSLMLDLAYSKSSSDPSVVEISRLVGTGFQERPEELGQAQAAPKRP
jgi:hypothetical protein